MTASGLRPVVDATIARAWLRVNAIHEATARLGIVMSSPVRRLRQEYDAGGVQIHLQLLISTSPAPERTRFPSPLSPLLLQKWGDIDRSIDPIDPWMYAFFSARTAGTAWVCKHHLLIAQLQAYVRCPSLKWRAATFTNCSRVSTAR